MTHSSRADRIIFLLHLITGFAPATAVVVTPSRLASGPRLRGSRCPPSAVTCSRCGVAGNNVLSIALEVPDDLLAGPVIGVWATISLRKDNTLVQMDRGGNPTINPFINPDGEKDLYNSRQPADDVANYLGPWSQILENSGYPPEEARQAALMVLPDTLRYDRTKSAAYPNGRGPTDDVYSMRFAWLSHGKVPPTGLKPHDDLLNEFPYLGPPHL